MAVPLVEIRGSGDSYAIFHKGRQVGKANGFDNACVRARVWESRLQRQHRNCMCCGELFEAQGRFNRLCIPCKQVLA
ncbi:MAG: hypothetical protein A2092_15780 [Rhodobacteraceae bacterium GWE1_64_9]|nr:MAG: hypothetical protein A2092_15780 [Rhodobacteraceae bacterium GWE1_64_9]OHC50110.1 MAG: hypothetical protein A2X69_01840 [Rhodobacteraceae bacterium GWF1_65_7]HBD90230.1 hypothetical protein [Gemmobacter sp.]HBU15209.1 hypothetical protein [Gemmobacter sp.]